MEEFGDKIHKAILGEPTKVEFVNKKGKHVISFKVGLLNVDEAIRISKIAYGVKIGDRSDLGAIHEAVSTQGSKVISIIAIMLKSRSKLPTALIKLIIRKYSTPDDLVRLISLAYDAMSVKSFMNSIILLTGMSLLKKEEIIASMEKKKKGVKA